MKLDWTELVLQFPIPLWFGSIKGLKGRLLRLMRDSKTLFHTNNPPEINWTAHKSAWECELGSHISALRSDLSAATPGPDCLVSSYSSARTGSSGCSHWLVKVSVDTSLLRSISARLNSPEQEQIENKPKETILNQKQGSATSLCSPQTVVRLLCHRIACVCF